MGLNTDSQLQCLNTKFNTLLSLLGQPKTGAITQSRGTIATGGTAQTLQAAQARNTLAIQNTSAGDLRVTFDGDTPSLTDGLLIPSGALWENQPNCCPQTEVKVWGATTGQTYEILTS